VLIISCPNKAEYTDKRGTRNEFHVKELYRDELDALVRKRFAHATWYGQKPSFFSVIAPERVASAAGQLVEVREKTPDHGAPLLASPVYFILVAARERSALDAVAPVVSVFADFDDWAYNDWYKVSRENREKRERLRELEGGPGAIRRWLARWVK
jgi:hypothetical protein